MAECPDEAELERLGLYDPGAAEAADRLRLLTRAFELGATLDEVIRACRAQGVNPLILDLAMRPPGETQELATFAERSGVDPDLVRRLWLAFGLPDSRDPPLPVTPDAADALLFTAGMTTPLGEEVVLALARMIGSSTARMAEAIAGAFWVGIETPQRLGGPLGLTRHEPRCAGRLTRRRQETAGCRMSPQHRSVRGPGRPLLSRRPSPRPPPPVRLAAARVWSADDVFLAEAQMRDSGEHVQGSWRYERIKGSSHWMQLDATDRLNQLVLDHIAAAG